MIDPLNVLLICNYEPHQAAAVQDHIRALHSYSKHNLCAYSGIGDLPADLDLERFDAVICHYSIFMNNDRYLSPVSRSRIRAYRGLKAAFVQDEYRQVNATVEAISYLGIHVLFTCVPEHEWEKVYPTSRLPGLDRVNVLTGYVPEHLANYPAPPADDRPIDVGYRGRRYPAWHGALGHERIVIAERFLHDAPDFGLKCDITTNEGARLYGQRWINFLTRCKAVLGTESGASVFDFTGEIERAVRQHLALRPAATYEEIRELYVAQHENRIKLNQISPRCFEAIALKTLMVLYEGEYSGILTAERHYIPLRKDHKNMKDVVSILKDRRKARQIVETAFTDIAMNPRLSYRAFVSSVDEKLSLAATKRRVPRNPYTRADFSAAFGDFDSPYRWHLVKSRMLSSAINLAERRLMPILPRRAQTSARNLAAGVRMTVRQFMQRRPPGLRRGSRPEVPVVPGYSGPPQELNELQSRLRSAAALSAVYRMPTVSLRLDLHTNAVTVSPEVPMNEEVVDIDAFVDCLKQHSIVRFAWLPASRLGLSAMIGTMRSEEFANVGAMLVRQPDIVSVLFPPSMTVFLVSGRTDAC